MNKLLTKIVGVVLGTSMAVGVGTAVVAKNSKGINSEVNASEQTVTIEYFSQGYSNDQVVTSTTSGVITTTHTKGGTNDPKYFNTGTGLRIYNGGSYTVTTSAGTLISATLTFSSNSYMFANNNTSPTCTNCSWSQEKDSNVGVMTAGSNVTSMTAAVTKTCRLQKVVVVYDDGQGGATLYKVSYNANLDAYTGVVPSEQTQASEGAAITLASALSQTKYTFLGWNTSKDGGSETRHAAGSSYTPASNTTMYGEWEQSQFDVIYDANGGTGTMTDSNSPYNKNSSVTVLSNAFTGPDDFVFDSWNTKADGTGTRYESSNSFNINADTTLYAQWAEPADATKYALKYALTPKITGSDTSKDGAYAYAVDTTISYLDTDVEWSVECNSSLTPWRVGGKNLSGVDRSIYSKDTIDFDIKKVELDSGEINGATVNSITLIVASNSNFSTRIDTVTKTIVKASGTLKFRPTAPLTSWGSGRYYKFVYNLTVTATSSNKFIELSAARFYEEAPASVETINVTAGSLSGKYKGDGTIQCSAEADGVLTNEVVWTLSSNTTYVAEQTSVSGASIDASGKVTFTNNVTVYAFATSTITTSVRNYAQCVASGLLDAPAFNLITSTDQLYDGMTIVIGATDYSKIMSTTQNANNRGTVASHQNGSNAIIETFSDDYQELLLGIEEMTDGRIVYNFFTENGYLYAAGTGNTDKDKYNYLRTEEDLDNNGRFTINIDSETKVATIEAQGSNDNKYLRFNSSNGLFSCYPEATSVQNASIYAATQSLTNKQRCDTFVTKYMHMNHTAFSSTDYIGECDAEVDEEHNTPYTLAKAAFNALPGATKEYFIDNSDSGEDYYDAYLRLHYWALANGEDFDIVDGEYVLKSNVGNRLFGLQITESTAVTTTVILLSILTLTTLGGYFLLRKRKEER